MNKSIILDRDGVINIDKGYVHKIKDFKFIPGVFEALKELQKYYILFIYTSQSGIGRGYYTENDFKRLNDFMLSKLKDNGIVITKVVFCPHKPEDNCNCRKPKTKLVDYLIKKYNINTKTSYIIGDKTSDIKLADNLGMKSVLVKTGKGGKDKKFKIKPMYIANNLLEASKRIINEI